MLPDSSDRGYHTTGIPEFLLFINYTKAEKNLLSAKMAAKKAELLLRTLVKLLVGEVFTLI